MPYRIRREDGKYCLHNVDTGKRVPGSCHESRSDTLRMLQAIESNLSEKSPSYTILTPTEMVVARYMIAGLPDKLIADKIGIKQKTANWHTANVLRKVNVTCRSALAIKMLLCNLISLEDLSTLYEIGVSERAIDPV